MTEYIESYAPQTFRYRRSSGEWQPTHETGRVLGACASLMLVTFQGCAPQTSNSQSGSKLSASLPPSQSEALALLNAGNFAELDARFSAVQADYRNSVISDLKLRDAFSIFCSTDASLQTKYDAWITKFPSSYVAHLARGIYYKKVGEKRRGGNFIAETTNDQLQGMDAAFAIAIQDLKTSATLDKRPLLTYLNEMSIALYEGDAPEIRALLVQSPRVDPQNVIVRHNYMGTLKPRWGGSVQNDRLPRGSRNAGLSAPKLQLLEAVII